MSSSASQVGDAELITLVRKGNLQAYGDLFAGHVTAARNLAGLFTHSQDERDDLVAEAFEKVLAALRAGRGPDSAFRAYLLTVIRHCAIANARRDRRLELAEDVSKVNGMRADAVSTPFIDRTVPELERSLAARAFAKLPKRWQAVLWYTVIEGLSPARAALIFGLTPNGLSALRYRALEGLRQAYLQVWLSRGIRPVCQGTAGKLGAWIRDGLSKRDKQRVDTHLDRCAACRALAAELSELNSALRSA